MHSAKLISVLLGVLFLTILFYPFLLGIGLLVSYKYVL